MANSTSGMFQTLVAASSLATQSLRFQNAGIRSIYLDHQPNATFQPFTTLNVLIPTVNEGDVENIGAGPLQPKDTTHNNVSITLDFKESTSFSIQSWDQVRTPARLNELFMQPKLEGLLRKVNRRVMNLLTSTNFNTYTKITGGSDDKFSRAELATCWANLDNAGVPTDDANNLVFLTDPIAYANMMSDTAFFQESIVGVEASVRATQRAMIAPQFNATIRRDQQMPIESAGKKMGIMMHRYAVAMVIPSMPSLGGDIQETTIFPIEKLPIQVQMQPSLIGQGTVINMQIGFGVRVVRPEYGSTVEST